MTHKQILDKIGFIALTQAIDEDLARLVTRGLAFKKGGSITDVSSYVLPKILMRWNCVLLADSGLAKFYKEKVVLTLAILLHKYGFSDNEITKKATIAIDTLNDGVVLSDDFYRKSSQIKDFLLTKPKELKRKPAKQQSITFFRAKDVISINVSGKFYIAYIHELTGTNESPVIELYDVTYDKKPTLEDIKMLKAKGVMYNDGIIRKARFAIYGMKYQPDFANQIHLLKSCSGSEMLPEDSHLEESVGVYTVSNLFVMQDKIIDMFAS